MLSKDEIEQLAETLTALTDTFQFLKEQDPKDLVKNKVMIFELLD